MSSTDWSLLTTSLSSPSVARGVTAGITPPPGGGSFIYGFNSLAVVTGAVGLFCSLTGFAPMSKGGTVRGAMQRGLSGGPTNFSPVLFIGLQGSTVNNSGYLLGLVDEEPHRIALRKGALNEGIPVAAPGSLGILRRSNVTFSAGSWVHLRLDMVVNDNGDVILKSFLNDLTVNPVNAPIWTPISGMDDFTDDALGINSGSAPFIEGIGGYGFQVKDVSRRCFFDALEVQKQLLG